MILVVVGRRGKGCWILERHVLKSTLTCAPSVWDPNVPVKEPSTALASVAQLTGASFYIPKGSRFGPQLGV